MNLEKMKKSIALLQVRMRSSRLPGKTLMKLCGKTILEHVVERCLAASLVQGIVVATSAKKEDDAIEDFCTKKGIDLVRGHEMDICSRMYKAICNYSAEHYLRFCGDAPMQDPEIIDRVIQFHFDTGADYTTNGVGNTRTFPLGIDVRIAKRQLYIDSYEKRDEKLKLMENPLAYVHENIEMYKTALYTAKDDLARPELRFIVDYVEDMKILREVFEALYPEHHLFGIRDAIVYVDANPHLKILMNKVKEHLRVRISFTSSDNSFVLKNK